MIRLAAAGAAMAFAAGSAAAAFDTVIEFTVRNTTATVASAPTLQSFLPAFQRGVVEVAGERLALEVEAGASGGLMQQALPALAPYQVLTLRVSLERRSAMPTPPIDPARYLAEDAYAPSRSAAIVTVTERLGLDHSLSALRRAADWVRGHVARFERTATRRGALYALDQGRGDCTEQADLVVAILRAAGVPARLVSGYTLDGTGRVAGAVRHDWAEALIDGDWVLVDPLNGAVAPERARYLPFRYHVPRAEPESDFHLFSVDPATVAVSMVLLRVPVTPAPVIIVDYAASSTLHCSVPEGGPGAAAMSFD